jgi:hypothetical protein
MLSCDRHRLDADLDPDSTFHFDADPDPVPDSDPDQDPISSSEKSTGTVPIIFILYQDLNTLIKMSKSESRIN